MKLPKIIPRIILCLIVGISVVRLFYTNDIVLFMDDTGQTILSGSHLWCLLWPILSFTLYFLTDLPTKHTKLWYGIQLTLLTIILVVCSYSSIK